MKKLYLLTFLLFGLTTQAQLILENVFVDPGGTLPPVYVPNKSPAQIVTQDLVGMGVTPFNIKFRGDAAAALVPSKQVDKFSTNFNLTSLGFLPNYDANGIRIFDNSPKGMLMTTGESSVALGPNNNGSKSIDVPESATGDPDLRKITTNDVEHASIVEFDFMATGPVLNFDFIFASEEYPEYSLSPNVNDVFGFFLSGPGIVPDVIAPDVTPSFTNNAKNIALIPGTTTPVSIFNVNHGLNNTGACTNCLYYVNNGQGTSPAANTSIQYDGFTTVLRATADLQCGQIYHIKLAVGNVGDNLFDSAVFLKNFQIAPMKLTDALGNQINNVVIGCWDDEVTINSGIPAGTNTFTWTHDTVLMPGVTTPSITVTENGVYELTVYSATGCLIGKDDITVNRTPFPLREPLPKTICVTGTGPYSFNIDQTAYMLNGLSASDYTITYYTSLSNAENGISPIPIGSLTSYLSAGAGELIWVKIEDLFVNGCIGYRSFPLNAVSTPSGTFSYTGSPYCSDVTTPQLPTLSGLTSGGT
ncbi:choice-of-anchor L domain-containing protein, partial [Flavobacterium humi]